jgi:Cytochrome P460
VLKEVSMKITFSFLILALLASVAGAEDTPEIDEGSVFELRGSLKLLTPTPHLVSATLAELCVTPTPDQYLSAEKDRAGPHANIAVNFYVSTDGAAAMSSTELEFPTGTIVLKEKLSPSDGQVAAVGGMVKRAKGFDPENGNWEYFYAAKSGGFQIGKIPNCVSCHARVSASDHVYSRGKGSR